MAFSPDTIIRLCNVPLAQDQIHQLSFTSRAGQTAYFAGTAVHTFTSFTLQRKDSVVKVSKHIDELWNCNYCMYDNAQFGGRWIYGFITKLEYLGDTATAVHIQTDVFQTWMLDCTFRQSFVEREHILTDTVGANLVEEGLETGEYVKRNTTTVTDLNDLAFIMAVSEGLDGFALAGRLYNGIYSGLAYIPYFGANKVGAISVKIKEYADAGKAEAIRAIFTFPTALLQSGASSGSVMTSDQLVSPVINKTVSYTLTTLDGYTVKNKKLLTHPYNFLHATNLQGQSADFRFEMLTTNNGSFLFAVYGSCMPGAKIGCFPVAYKTGTAFGPNWEEGITLQNYPLCGWVTSAWDNWIAQNSIGLATSAGTAVMSIGAGLATGQPLAVGGGIVAVMSQLQQLQQKAIEPDHAKGNSNGSTLNISAGMQTIEFHQMQIRADQAQRLDKFFDMYGYKTNQVKVPNLTGRPFWNYVKTIDANITGPIPQSDLVELRNMFNSGVTLWHNPANIGNYSLNNHN